jgi:hypothetical protein
LQLHLGEAAFGVPRKVSNEQAAYVAIQADAAAAQDDIAFYYVWVDDRAGT